MRPENNQLFSPRNCRLAPGFARLATVAALLWAAACAHAAPGDEIKPVDIVAESAVYDHRNGTKTFTGSVRLSQGSMSIEADEIRIETRQGALYRIVGKGSPIRFQQLDDELRVIRGQSNELDYTSTDFTLTLQGDARLELAGQSMNSQTIKYNMRSMTLIAEGRSEGRVSIELKPAASAD